MGGMKQKTFSSIHHQEGTSGTRLFIEKGPSQDYDEDEDEDGEEQKLKNKRERGIERDREEKEQKVPPMTQLTWDGELGEMKYPQSKRERKS